MRFTPNRRGQEELLRGASVRAFLHEAAADVKHRVEEEAERFAETHHFAESIETTDVERSADGAKVTIYSTDFAAHIVEFGSINNPPYAPFRKAAAALGLRLRGGGERR